MHEMEKLLERNALELAELTESTGMPLVQENGQRRFGPLPGPRGPAKGKIYKMQRVGFYSICFATFVLCVSLICRV